MATITIPAGTPSTVFITSTGNFFGNFTTTVEAVATDNDPTSNFFETTDTITVTEPGETYTVTYLGYVTIMGTDYLVYSEPDDGITVVAGISLDIDSYPNVSALSINSGGFAACFAAGTLIATPQGEVAVDALAIGDMIRTADGRDVPVKWIGRQTVAKFFVGEKAQMVRIAAGTLGTHTDLCVTGDHGVIIDGYVVNASALVNGHSIDFVPLCDLEDRYAVYHIDTAAHDVILANGAAAETYLDTPGRQVFDNYHEYLALYGKEPLIAESQMLRISAQRLLPDRIRSLVGIEVEPQKARA